MKRTKDYGQIMRNLLEGALAREEEELKSLTKKAGGRVSLVSVREYDESWIALLLAKHQARSQVKHGIWTENRKIDVTLTKEASRDNSPQLAYFELKGPFEASGLAGKKKSVDCVKDIQKLRAEKSSERNPASSFCC